MNHYPLKKEKYLEKIPAYFTQHWPDGKPTGAWWLGNKRPKDIGEGFCAVFHPEQEVDITLLPCTFERQRGYAIKIQEVDLLKYTKIGSKLTWKQRLKGIL